MAKKTRPAVGSLPDEASTLVLERVALADLRPHPRNTQSHPEVELAHLMQSLENHGVYRNIVVARDGTILAGHGVVQAAARLGYARIEARRLDLSSDDPLALQVLVGDNAIAQLSQQDELLLAGLLQEMAQHNPTSLRGTGFDQAMLTALLLKIELLPPDFGPVGVETQGILDQKKPITCPHCGAEFTP